MIDAGGYRFTVDALVTVLIENKRKIDALTHTFKLIDSVCIYSI